METLLRAVLALLFPTVTLSCLIRAQAPEFMSLASARPVLQAMRGSLPPELKTAGAVDAAAWDAWVRAKDRAIRSRVAKGEELTLANLLRLGITYTGERRITFDLLSRYGGDPVVNSAVERRTGDLIRALAAPHAPEGMLQMRAFLKENGYSVNTPEAQKRTRAYLLGALVRQRDGVAREREKAKSSTSQLFKDRGLSTDSDLYTGYALDLHLTNLARSGVLRPGSVHRVAIIGPGLDFVNKKSGYDFYPPQTIQPYAVIDSLARLGLADAASIEVCTYDISPRVNQHIERARESAARGDPYTIQVLWNRSAGGSARYLSDFMEYWRRFGEQIGKPADAIAVPEAARIDLMTRAVRIRPAFAARISAVDMNVIFQTQSRPPEKRFDLVIGTNIFLYYDDLQQALARVNLAAMIKPGGLLVSNTILSVAGPSKLEDSVRTDIPLQPGLTDYVYSYLRRP